MATITTVTPFSTAARYSLGFQTWITDELDKQRIAAYQVWEDIYWGQVGVFSLTQQGTDGNPIVMPVARAMIEAINRYLAVDWDVYVDPTVGTAQEQAAAKLNFTQLFKRENVYAKFGSQKRWGLVKGDALWHVTADPHKDEGKRISLNTLDPASYFPIYADESLDRLTGCYLVDMITVDKKDVIRRQAYRREVDDDGNFTGVVTSELLLCDPTAWDDRYDDTLDVKVVEVLEKEAPLDGISQIPVYRVPNTLNPGDPFGSSVLRGVERLVEGISQTASDEDLAIALAGLGVYVTDAGAPVDENGAEVPWFISPGRVVELGAMGAKFDRVNGITSVEPSQSHMNYLEEGMNKGASVPAVALGQVDAASAESGIALYLKLSPLLAANAERETDMLGVYDQMLYDLQTMWFPAYESIDMSTVLVSTRVGDPMPENVQEKIADLNTLVTAKIMSAQTARVHLQKYGFEFAANEQDLISQETTASTAATDPFQARSNEETSGTDSVPADASTA